MGKNSLHEVLYSQTTHEHVYGKQIMPLSCMEISFTYMGVSFSLMKLRNFMHEIFMQHFFFIHETFCTGSQLQIYGCMNKLRIMEYKC